jgi:hypothetical protein
MTTLKKTSPEMVDLDTAPVLDIHHCALNLI